MACPTSWGGAVGRTPKPVHLVAKAQQCPGAKGKVGQGWRVEFRGWWVTAGSHQRLEKVSSAQMGVTIGKPRVSRSIYSAWLGPAHKLLSQQVQGGVLGGVSPRGC